MIQELFGASATGLVNQDPNPSPSNSSSTTTTTTITDNQKLRCPRCDSSHTKFCYYNNYNLTQPRHFCKTCRRYWTKGGALRNVSIGGGCRKNKNCTTNSFITGKLKAAVSSELESNPNNPILWSTPPQTSHLLSLFRATQNPNPNPNPNSFTSNPLTHMIKDQSFIARSNMGGLGFEPPLGLCSSLWRNNQQDHQKIQNQHEAVVQNTANYYHHDQPAVPLILGSSSMTNCTSSASTILDSAPVLASGELGFWNQTLPWSDLAASNGAYH
ncbi:uncharacterized protein LOC143575820 [Bidens hawaiensis]|uniref:uncharacterized protein LOC143575820 n=1 Tax=Bidens hawaiensis TaxID=980011 RepID=UPI004049C5A9